MKIDFKKNYSVLIESGLIIKLFNFRIDKTKQIMVTWSNSDYETLNDCTFYDWIFQNKSKILAYWETI